MGYSLEYPAAFKLKKNLNGRDLFLTHEEFPVVAINFSYRDEADDQGLWTRHEPVGDIMLAKKKGKKYIHNYHDGPFFMKTLCH